MTVLSTSAAVSHTGNGVADTFSFTFKVFSSADLYINKYEIATGTLTLLALTTDYTVSLTDGGASGGEVTLVAGPLPATHKIIIQRLLSYTQETDYVENDPFPAQSTEDACDKLTMLIQQLKEELDRALLGAITTEDGVIAIGYDSGLPAITGADANKLIHVNAASTAYELITVSNAITATINAAIAINTLDEKVNPVAADLLVIEDSADGNARKKVKVGNLGIGGSVDVYTSDDTWSKPAGATVVKVICVGGGGGGGAGQQGVAGGSYNACGGGGGGGGARTEKVFDASDLTDTVAITIGAGGTSGVAGGNTTFGSYLTGYGGAVGAAGSGTGAGGGGGGVGGAGSTDVGGYPNVTNMAGLGGGGGGGGATGGNNPGKNGEYGGGGGGSSVTNTTTTAGAGGNGIYSGAGGGAGGGHQGLDGSANGGAGGSVRVGGSGGGGTGGANGGSGAGTNGGNGADGDGTLVCGKGGGGGGSGATTPGSGGNGGAWGGGGGGGGSGWTRSGSPTANGGTGGNGGCIVISW